MNAEYVTQMIDCFRALQTACGDLADSMRQDDFPVLLPESDYDNPRDWAILAVTQLFKLDDGESLPRAGFVCCSGETITLANEVNVRKEQFKESVMAFKKAVARNKNFRLDQIWNALLVSDDRKSKSDHKHADIPEEVKLAFKRSGLARISLLRCYAKLLVLNENLKSISWTWAKAHSAMVPVNFEEAQQLAQKLPDEAREYALAQLSRVPPGEAFIRRKELPNQLRANLVYEKGEKLVREQKTVSGIALSPDVRIPAYVWRPNPALLSDPPAGLVRLPRSDLYVDPEPFIQTLHLHRYNGNPHGKTRKQRSKPKVPKG